METEQITIRVDAEAAKAFQSASADNRRKLEALLSIRLSEATKPGASLQQIIGEMSRKAQERGLSPEILQSILNED
jgi:hypothetical protein